MGLFWNNTGKSLEMQCGAQYLRRLSHNLQPPQNL